MPMNLSALHIKKMQIADDTLYNPLYDTIPPDQLISIEFRVRFAWTCLDPDDGCLQLYLDIVL